MFKDNFFFLKKGKLHGQELVNLVTHLQNLPTSVSVSGTVLETKYVLCTHRLFFSCFESAKLSGIFSTIGGQTGQIKMLGAGLEVII